MKRFTFLVLSLLVIMSLLLASCTPKETPTVEEPTEKVEKTTEKVEETKEEPTAEITAEVTEAPKTGGTLVLRLQADPVSMNIVKVRTTNVPAEFYEFILKKDADGNYLGFLVDSFEADIDALTYTFHMRDQDILFHDGSVLTSEVFAWNLNTYMESGFFASSFNKADYAEAVDDKTFVLHMKEWDMLIPNVLTRMAQPVSKEFVEANGGLDSLNEGECGTGPFMLKEWKLGEGIKTVRFDDYWQGTPYLDGIDHQIFSSPDVAVLALQNGDLDILNMFGISFTYMDQLEADPNLTIYEASRGGNAFTLGFNTRNPEEPLSDVKVRKAIAYAIDQDAIAEVLTAGYYYPGATQWSPSNNPYTSPNVPGFPYDVEKAKALLADAGYADGFTTTLRFRADFQEAGVLIQSYLKAIGIDCVLEPLDTANFDKFIRGWPDGMFIHTVGVANGQEYQITNSARSDVTTGFGSVNFVHSDELDQLAKQALSTTVEDSYQYIHRIAEIMFMEDVSMYVLALSKGILVSNSNVKDAGTCLYGAAVNETMNTAWIDE